MDSRRENQAFPGRIYSNFNPAVRSDGADLHWRKERTLVAGTLAISGSSLYCRNKPRGSRADRTYDGAIVMTCGEKPTYGYRRVA